MGTLKKWAPWNHSTFLKRKHGFRHISKKWVLTYWAQFQKTVNKWFFESLQNYNVAITLGNHDYFDEVVNYHSIEIAKNQTELYYSQEYNYYKFLFLDSSSGSISQEQLNWFKKELLTKKHCLMVK